MATYLMQIHHCISQLMHSKTSRVSPNCFTFYTFKDEQYVPKLGLLSIYSCARFQWTLQWRHNERDGVSNHPPHDWLLNCFSRRISKKTSKLRVTGLCAGNSPVTGEFPAQKACNAEMFPFDDVIMNEECYIYNVFSHCVRPRSKI